MIYLLVRKIFRHITNLLKKERAYFNGQNRFLKKNLGGRKIPVKYSKIFLTLGKTKFCNNFF